MTSTEIANLAISHLGVGKTIEDLDTEKSEEARVCRRFYRVNLEEVLRERPWPFATRIETLTVVEEDPNDEWAFSYRKPANCLMFRRVLSGVRNDNRQSRVPYRIIGDDEGDLILCDTEDAEGEYTTYISNAQNWPRDFCQAVALRLAALVAPTLTGADPFKRGDRALALYEIQLNRAWANAKNEEQSEEHPVSEFENARNGVIAANLIGGDDSVS